jgi:hypothetical protein
MVLHRQPRQDAGRRLVAADDDPRDTRHHGPFGLEKILGKVSISGHPFDFLVEVDPEKRAIVDF